jgi:hypothetical protein
MDDFEREVQALGAQLHAAASTRRPALYRGLPGALLATSNAASPT